MSILSRLHENLIETETRPHQDDVPLVALPKSNTCLQRSMSSSIPMMVITIHARSNMW